jgi:N,N'-diacetylchitobiose non-reducing end deacetylase
MPDTSLFSKPDIFSAKRILVVQPHYDDNDIQIGGTLAKLADSGVELIYLTVTDDLVGVIDQTLSPKKMEEWLKDNQEKAGHIIGVKEQYWLGYPDAGNYDYFDVQRDIIQHIRMIRPDFIITNDPWLPYEYHNDHIITGKATASAFGLYGYTGLETNVDVDESFKRDPFELKGIAFYATAHPNLIVDISDFWDRKQEAVAQYTAQFTDKDMQTFQKRLELEVRYNARESSFEYGETLKVMHSWQLHGFGDAWKV